MLRDAHGAVAYIESHGGEVFLDEDDNDTKPTFVVLDGPTFDSSAIDLLHHFASIGALSCRHTKISKEDIARLSPDLSLRSLTLEGDAIDDAFLKAVPSFGELEHIDVTSDRMTDQGIASLTRFQKLHVIHVKGSEIRGGFLASFRNHCLSRVWLMSTATDDVALSALGKHETITDLLLGDTRVTDTGLEALSRLPKLKNVRLNDTRILGPGVRHLATCKQLESIDLSNTGVSLKDVLVLETLPLLKEVYLENTRLSQGEANWFIARLPSQGMRNELILLEQRGGEYAIGMASRALTISCRRNEFGDAQVALLQRLLSFATTIDVSDSGVGDVGVAHIGRWATNCHTLRLAHTQISDASALEINSLPVLSDLDVSGCRIGDGWLREVVVGASIRRLHLAGTRVTDAGLSALSDLRTLEFVDLADTKVTTEGIVRIRENSPGLVVRTTGE